MVGGEASEAAAQAFVIVRREVVRGGGVRTRSTRSGNAAPFYCTDPEECHEECPGPTQGGWTTVCSCKPLGDGFLCVVRSYAPGEEIPGLGGGGGGCGGSGGAGGGGVQADCNNCTNEQSDLAEEYEDEGLTGWPCSTFSTADGHLILQDSDTENGQHNGNGFVHADLASGYTSTESNYGDSIRITSGYRCPAGDRATGGSGRGWHVFGRAVDIVPTTVNDAEWEALLDAVVDAGAIGIIDNSDYPSRPHIHARWGGG